MWTDAFHVGAALTVSWRRFGGTVLGAAAGALLSNYFQSNLAMFGVGVFLLGLVGAILRLGTAYRFAGVTLASNEPGYSIQCPFGDRDIRSSRLTRLTV